MGAFDGLKDASRGYTSNSVKDGIYAVRIDSSDFFETQNGESWKNSLTVLSIIEGSQRLSENQQDHRVGESVNTFFTCKAGKQGKEIFQRNLKAYMAGVLGCADDEIGQAEAEKASGEENVLGGLVTILTVRMQAHKTAKDEKTGDPVMYPIYSWSGMLTEDETKDVMTDEAFAKIFPKGFGQ